MKLSREIKTGIIVIGGILLFILGFTYLKASPLFDDSKIFYAVYADVGGLQPGTQVSINGFSVGKVQDIRFKDASGELLVTFSVNNGFDFSRNSIAELYDTGIIGGKGIQIIPVFDDDRLAESRDTLPSNIQPGLTELVQQNLSPLQMKVEGAVTNADSLLIHFNDVLDESTRSNLRESIRGLNQLVASFQKSADGINDLLIANRSQLDSTLKNFNTASGNLSRLTDSLNEAGLGETIRNMEATLSSLNTIMSKMEQGEGTMGKLMQDEALYENLANASRELDLLLQDFRLNPKRYVNVSVFGKKQKEYTVPENDPADNQSPQ